MKEVKITIPDNCELVKKGNSYIIKKKDSKPRTWEEFCKNYPITEKEYYIDKDSHLVDTLGLTNRQRKCDCDKYFCVSREEAKAFLALMQLRQLRKAWIGDWEQPSPMETSGTILYDINAEKIVTEEANFWAQNLLSFPTKEMATEFLECFRDLCEQAKLLL